MQFQRSENKSKSMFYPLWPHRLVPDIAYGRWITFMVLFAILFLLFYFTTGSLDRILDLPIPLFFCFIIAYIVPASHYICYQNLAAFDNIAPGLNLSIAEIVNIRSSLAGATARTQILTLVIGLVAGGGHNYLLMTAQRGFMESMQLLDLLNGSFILVTFVIWCLIINVIGFLAANVWVVARLAANVEINLLNTTNLRGFSRVAVYSTLLLIGTLASFPLLMTGDNTNYLTVVPGAIAILVSMVFIFLVPMLPIRKRIKAGKNLELEAIQERINRVTQAQSSLLESTETLSQLQPLFDYRREIQRVAEWPFDSPAFYRLLFYLFIPPLTWVGAALIERLVDTVNF
ncbi:MAG: hypothetical protein ABGY96_22170 [bacterium]|nr:hypothetical protein [Gammaproteobacteria bacterium]HIL94426.1 hypothetical protein [Pseudomonadales bacterium]